MSTYQGGSYHGVLTDSRCAVNRQDLAGARTRPQGDYKQSPFLVLWELTRSCSLACRHCRAKAIRRRNPDELSFEECCRVLDSLKEFSNPLIVLTGGDPVEREDLLDIIKAAKDRNFTVAITPSATDLTTEKTVRELAEAGIDRIAVSIDGPDAASHDDFRRVQGSFAKSLQICQWAMSMNVPLQINTSITKHNVSRMREMAALSESLGPVLWSIFFLVPTGRASQDMQISRLECEVVLHQMAQLSARGRIQIKATAGPQFRRVLLEELSLNEHVPPNGDGAAANLMALRAYQSVNDGKGVMFISHTGDIYPSGFLPVTAGNVRVDSLVDVYRNHPLFTTLRDSDLLKGKCGRCKYRNVCGGSRARAYAATGDYMDEDPLCLYDQDCAV
jgi:AdoMet-dependent heme synthase